MNFYYAACVCHSIWLCLLIFVTTSQSWEYITWNSKMNMCSYCETDLWFHSLWILVFWNWKKSARQMAHIEFVCLFFHFKWQFQLDCDRQISNHTPWQTTMWMDIWITVFHKFGPYETIWHCCIWKACMCSHLFFPINWAYSAVILEILQISIRCFPKLSFIGFYLKKNKKIL